MRGADDKCLVKSVAGQILVGDFTHEDGTRYVMIVNRDFTQSVYCSPQFREAGSKVEQVSPYSGQLTPFSGEYAWLAPGQGALLKLSL